MRAFLFPGQGSQTLGMGKDLYENSKTAQEIFDKIDDSLNFKLSKIMFEGPIEDLNATHNTQPAIMAVSLALYGVLQKDFNFDLVKNVKFLAGHSLGEYSALAVAESLSVEDTAKLLKARGEFMLSASPVGLGGMAAILGVSNLQEIQELINQVKIENEICVIANDNCVGQVVISGHLKCIDRFLEKAKESGIKSVKLAVSGSFHSPLMQKASEKMAELLNTIIFKQNKLPIISNVMATAVSDPLKIKSLLVEQVVKGVRWRESMDYIINNGVTEVVEIGSSNVLTGLMKRISPNINRVNIQSLIDVENFVNSIK
jgi:[acyl-carrier-protein] S-malonyltransferase